MQTKDCSTNQPSPQDTCDQNTENNSVDLVNYSKNQTRTDVSEQLQLERFKNNPSLNLQLSITPPFVKLLRTALGQEKASPRDQSSGKPIESSNNGDDLATQEAMEMLKAANFPALLLQIGDWKVVSSENKGDLEAKFFYAERQLVWEILESGLKNKIEIQWADIMAIRAVMEENKPGILEVELIHPPSFYREMNPESREHSLWKPTQDFTGGQATSYRRHRLKFPPRALDKPYEKLLQFDKQLFQLSKSQFPRMLSPFFPRAKHHPVPSINPSRGQVHIYPDIPQAPVIPYRREELQGEATPPVPRTIDPNAFVTDEDVRVVTEWLNRGIDESRGENASQRQQMISFSNASVQDQIRGKEPVPLATQVNTGVADQTHDPNALPDRFKKF